MSNGGQQQGGGHGLPHGDDHGHFPEEEILNDMGDRSFKMPPHDKESIKEIGSNEEQLNKIIRLGTEKARASAQATMNEVREAIGFKTRKL